MEPLYYHKHEAYNRPALSWSHSFDGPHSPPRLPASPLHKRRHSRPSLSHVPGLVAVPNLSPTNSSSAMSENAHSRPSSSTESSSLKRSRAAYETAEPGSFGRPRYAEQRHAPPPPLQYQQRENVLLPPINTGNHGQSGPGPGLGPGPGVGGVFHPSAYADPSSTTTSYGSLMREDRQISEVRQCSTLSSPPSGVSPAMQCRLNIRQQPEVARACGFGERDRRVVDPPPVVELELEMPAASTAGDIEELNLSQYVVHATLFNEDGSEDVGTFLQQPRTAARRLVGSLASTPAVAADEFGHRGAFFTFADLSCREPGAYRMRFTLVQVGGTSAQVLAQVMSEVFRVFTPKDFPGMRRSTPLTNALKIQGVSIPAKKGRHITMSK